MNLIYISPVPLSSFTQRPHEFVEYFHRQYDAKVLWLNPYPGRLPQLSDFKRPSDRVQPKKECLPEWLEVVEIPALPIEPLGLCRWLNFILFWRQIIRRVELFCRSDETLLVVGKPSLLASILAKQNGYKQVVYDCMDDFGHFYSGISSKSMLRMEKAIIKSADLVIASSHALLYKLRAQHPNVQLVPNACSADKFTFQSRLNRVIKKKVCGYVGTIGTWFDWESLYFLADAFDSLEFEIIGPVFSQPMMKLPPNVKIFPPIKHSEAIERMAGFDIALIPFLKNGLTNAVDPIKFYEYSSLGLPIVSSDFGEMAHRSDVENVFLYREKGQLIDAMNKALLFESDTAKVNLFMRENSWHRRFDSVKLGC